MNRSIYPRKVMTLSKGFVAIGLFLLYCLIATTLQAQNVGDYRTASNSGGAPVNWTTAANWQRFDGATWVAAPDYPGQNAPTISLPNMQTVTIRRSVNLTGMLPEDIGNLVINGSRTLNVSTNISLRLRGTLTNGGTCTGCTNFFYLADRDFRSTGTGNWSVNGSWQRYDNATKTWVAATEHPGQNAAVYNRVFVRNGHTITLNTSPDNEINRIVVENGATLTTSACDRVISTQNVTNLGGTYTPSGVGGVMLLQNGDYRTAATGNWNNLATWQTYNGTSWVAATAFPGQNISPSTQDVIIRSPHNVTVNVNITDNTVRGIFIETGATITSTNILEVPSVPLAGASCGTLTNPANVIVPTSGIIRTKSIGQWSDGSIWQMYDAVSGNWTTGTFPGQLPPASGSLVQIRHNINGDLTPFEDVNDLTIETGITLNLEANKTIRVRGIFTNNGACAGCTDRVFTLAAGDYRSSGSGNWSVFGTHWEKYDGTNWNVASEAPGSLPEPGTGGQRVFVRTGSNMTLNISPTNDIGKLIIENGSSLTISGCNYVILTGEPANPTPPPTDAYTNYGTFNAGSGKYIILNAGDYRSVATGNWTVPATWQKYDGTTWGASADAPGDVAPVAGQDVIVRASHTITVDAAVTAESVGDLFVASTGTVNNSAFQVRVNSLKNCGTINTPANVIYNIIAYRTVGNGNWDNIANWESTSDGVTWNPATDYPGQSEPVAMQDVTIQTGHTVTLNITPTEDIGELIIDGSLIVGGTNTIRRRDNCTGGGCAATILVNTNDYRTIVSGNWTTVANWQKFNGTTWVTSADYPGQVAPVGSPNVFVRTGHSMILNATPPNETHNLILESAAQLSINTCNNLKIKGTFTENGIFTPNNGGVFTLTNGDFRSVLSGNWTASATWQTYNGTTWVAAANHPGFNLANADKNVFIRSGHTVTLDDTPIEDVKNFIIETGGTFTIAGNFDVRFRGSFINCGTYTPNAGTVVQLQNGDYRSTGTGNWNNVATWEVFNGTTWIAASDFPGQSMAIASGTVIIRKGHAITSPTTPNNINNLLVETTASLTINGGQSITATGTVINYGTITGTLNFTNFGSYRSIVASGSWSSPSSWERFNGSAWVAATDYPGQTPSANPPLVQIRNGHTIDVDISPLDDISYIDVNTGGTLTFTAGNTIRARSASVISGTCADCATAVNLIATGDYRSKVTTGNWGISTSWEVFNGSYWENATIYPGETNFETTYNLNTQKIYIRNGHDITLNVTPIEDISRLLIESGGSLTIDAVNAHSLRARSALVSNGNYTPNGGAYIVVATNDYRSRNTGNWGVNTSWQKYNGTSWTDPAGEFPGATTATFTSRVFVRNGHTITHNISPAEDIGRLFVQLGGNLNMNTCHNIKVRISSTIHGTITAPSIEVATQRIIKVNNGDYRSSGTGNWTANTSWEKYNGTSWAAAGGGDYPGAAAAALGQNIIIRTGHTITFDANPPQIIYNIYVESGATLADGGATLVNVDGRNVTDAGQQCGTVSESIGTFVYGTSARFYRTRNATGNWSNPADWEIASDTTGAWVVASDYPGQRVPPTGQIVFVRTGQTMNVNISPYEEIAQLRIDGSGTLNFSGGFNLKVWGATVQGNTGGLRFYSGTLSNVTNLRAEMDIATNAIINNNTVTAVITNNHAGGSITYIQAADYRTVSSGNWDDINNWERFNTAAKWVKATIYPGQGAPSSTESVIIRRLHTMTINVGMPLAAATSVVDLVVEDEAILNANANTNVSIQGNITNHGTINLAGGAFSYIAGVGNIRIDGSALATNFIFNNIVFGRSSNALTTQSSFSIIGNFTNNSSGSATFTASSPSNITFNGNKTQFINGSSTLSNLTFFDITLNNSNTVLTVNRPITVSDDISINGNAKVSNNNTVTVLTSLSADASAGSQFINNTSATLIYRGTAVPFASQADKLVAIATNNIVQYDRQGDQGIYPSNYFNLIVRTATPSGVPIIKTMNVGTGSYEVRGQLTLQENNVQMTVAGTTGRLLNQRALMNVGTKYNYNANDNTNTNGAPSPGELSVYNGPGSASDNYASNFSGRFDRVFVSNNAGNEIRTNNLNDIRFTRGAAGSVYAVRTVNIPDLLAMGGSAAVVRFDVVGSTNNTSFASAARILVGTGFTDDNSVASGTIASQLNVNFEGSSNISFTSQPANTKVVNNFTSNTGARRKRITWVINTSSGTLNYTPPNGGATENVPANRIDIWDGNTRVANDLNVVTNGAIINNLKIVLYDAQGSFTLENIKINPIAELLTGNYTQTMLTGNPDPTKPLCFSIGTDYNVTLGGGTNAPYSTNSPASFVYNPNNEFVFHLSAPDGTFTNFTIIGRTASTTLSSSFPLVIPKTILPTMATGSNFRIRVVSTDPPMVAQMSTNPLSILSFSIVKASDNSAPVLQAITTTAPNQFTDNFKINTGSYAGAATYQWKVRYKSSGMIHNIPAAAGGTASTFQGNGTLSTFAGHFPYGTGEYELFCEVTTNPTSASPSGCGVVNTPIVRVIVECDGCPKNSMASSCSKNIVFNGSFTNGSNASPVYPASLPDPNDPNSEGVIPFDGAGMVYGAPSPNIVFFNENRTQTYGSVTLKFNTPYGYSTEYGGTTSSNFQTNMGNEVSAATEGNGTSMFPENTWAVGTNPRHYHSNFCDADGNVPVPQGNVGLGGGAATWTTMAMGLPATDPRTGPPFTNLPFTVTSYNGGGSPSLATPTVYSNGNNSPSGGRFITANGSPFTANKVWSQRFKVRKNTDYVFSFWAVNLNDINAIYGVFANCTQIGNGIRATGVADRCVWKQYTFLWNSGEVGTVEFSVRNVSTVRSGNDLSVDDIMFYRCDGNTNNFPTSNKFVWRGYNTDWFNADNWGNCAIPDCTSDVIVPINASNIYPIIQASALTNSPDTYASGHPAMTDATRNTPAPSLARVRSISIDYGANITITPGWNLDVCGDFTNKKNEAFPPSLNQGIIGQDGSTITFTALDVTTYTAKVTGNLTNQTGANNSLPNVVIRKKSNTQIVELQDDLDIAGDLVIVDGTFDANQKNISFNGEKFINGTTNYTNTYYDGTNNPALATNSAFVNMGEGGASFDHGSGVVEFRNLRSTGDQIYSREPVVMTCSSCLENFYDVKMNQESENRDLDIQRGNFNVENTLELSTGHLFTSVTNGQKEVYVSNSSTTSILNYSEQSYVVTTIDAGGSNANNLRLRREVDNTGVYEFPIGGDASGGKDPTGAFNGYRLVTMTLNQPLAGVNSVRSYFSTNDPGGATNLPSTVADACSNNNLSYDICGGGHWDLVPLDGAGSTVAVVSPNYNLEMLSIPSAFTCAGANITFMKRTNGGDPWGFGGSCYVSVNRRDNFTSFSKIVPVGTNEILPVEFLSFDAIRNKSAVDVKWETISERGASHFIVQRSADGKNFVNIGRIQAIGNANTTQKYLFTDMTPMQGMNYYRLQQVDIDNTEILTNVVAIMFEGDGGDLIIYPNPSEENAVFNVIIPTQMGADVELKMTDALGREVYMQRVKFSGVAIQVPANFAKGLYTLSVATPTESYVRKLIIK